MRLARQEGKVHPKAWVELFESHTLYEWQLQVALEQVEPTGDDRNDLRDAWNTAQLIASNRTEPLTDNEFRKLVDALSNYLQCKRPIEDGE